MRNSRSIRVVMAVGFAVIAFALLAWWLNGQIAHT